MHKYKQIINNDIILKQVMPFIKDHKAYLVGGFIRDIILGLDSLDRDIIVENCDVEELAKKICKGLDAHFVPLDPENKIYRIVLKDKLNYIDLTAPIGKNIEQDILRRDLTINAVAFDLQKNEFLDLANGIKDIENKIIRGISEQNFIDDPLRLLRIFRFYSKFGFKINEELKVLVKKHASNIEKPAKERINTELIKLFEGKYADIALKEMDDAGLLEYILPIMNDVKQIPPNTHHHLDLFGHSIETVKQVQKYYENAILPVKEHLEANLLGSASQLGFLKLAAFCHDIGKPSTWTIEEETEKHRFFKHDEIGSKLIIPILKDLKFSKKQISYIQKMIKYHIYPSAVVCQEPSSEKSQMRFFRKMEDYVIDVIIIAAADRLSAQGPEISKEHISRNLNGLNKLLEKYFEIKEDIKPLEKLIDGTEIMELLNIKASKKLGNIIKALKEAQICGDITTKSEAIEFIKQLDID